MFKDFNIRIINVLHDLVLIVKLQVTFYEKYGHDRLWAFKGTADYIRSYGLIVIGGCKRGDRVDDL